MSVGNQIVISSDPRGRFTEGYINAPQLPGTVVQIDVSEGKGADGRFDWEAYDIASVVQNGAQRLIAVLIEDSLQGRLMTTAYTSGDRCRIYFPLPGDELNMVVKNLSGTGDDHSFGALLMVEDSTGKLIATAGTPESEPFILLEAITDPTADTWAHCMFAGY